MDVEPSDGIPDLGSVWQSGGGPLCFSRVIPVPALVLPEFPDDSRHRCVRPPMAECQSVRVSANKADSGSTMQSEGERCPSPSHSPCNNVRKEGRKRTGLAWEDSGGIYSDKLKQLRTLRALKHQLSRLSPRSLSAFVSAVSRSQTVRPSLHSISLLEFPLHGGFIGSLHANYCNQTQVFLILHLTHLLTAVSGVFLPLQTSLNHAPSPHTPTARLRPGSPPACSPPPHSWRGSRLQSSASPACGSP